MTTYRISTPGPVFTRDFPDMNAAVDWAEQYLPMKRGYTRRRVERDGVHYTAVLNTKGKQTTGAAVRAVQ